MDNEKLERAKQIEKQISDLLSHRASIETAITSAQEHSTVTPMNLTIHPKGWTGYKTELKPELCPISPDVFGTLYVMNVNNTIAKLEAEFAAL